MSLVLKPKISLDRAYRINMAVSVAVSRSMCALYGLDVGIKWPNDLLIGGRKVCGILMEISAEVDRVDWAVVGLGINANIDVMGFSVDWKATSLRQELCQDVSRIDLIQRLLLEIEGTYHRMHSRDLYEEWRRRSVTLGKQVRITSASGDLSGEAIDLAEDGALLIRAEDKIKRVLAGDCIHLRAPGEA
jgi:BirA family biotin operon repressor/biotin-[acetyl-CoA-carboxylase] ligase